MVNVRRRERGAQRPDRADILARIDAAVAATTFPAELTTFVRNWGSLSPEAQKRVKYAVRYWAPWIATLSSKGYRVYLKQAFELVSDIPPLASLRDQRVNTAGDYHLIDEDPGRSQGQMAVIDLAYVMEHPFGMINVAAHEVAHQFDTAAPESIRSCITTLYQRASVADVFPDDYASTNRFEYFAEGVTYYSVEADVGPNFGITRQWFADHDPSLYALLQAIGEGTTPLDELVCPQ